MADGRVRIEMVIGWYRWWLPWRPKQIRMAKVTTRTDARHMAQQIFADAPKVVAIALIGPTWVERIARDDWMVAVDKEPS